MNDAAYIHAVEKSAGLTKDIKKHIDANIIKKTDDGVYVFNDDYETPVDRLSVRVFRDYFGGITFNYFAGYVEPVTGFRAVARTEEDAQRILNGAPFFFHKDWISGFPEEADDFGRHVERSSTEIELSGVVDGKLVRFVVINDFKSYFLYMIREEGFLLRRHELFGYSKTSEDIVQNIAKKPDDLAFKELHTLYASCERDLTAA